jgi:hypothetical protein
MEDGYYDDLTCQLHDLADDYANVESDVVKNIVFRLRELARLDIREDSNWKRCEYEGSRYRCPHPTMNLYSRLCSYHGTVSSVRFDPRWWQS